MSNTSGHPGSDPFQKLIVTAKSRFIDLSDRVREAAGDMRERLDDPQTREMQRKVFEEFGSKAYTLYRETSENLPDFIGKTTSRLDQSLGVLQHPDKLRYSIDNTGNRIRERVQEIAEDLNDLIDRTLKGDGSRR